MPFMLAKTLVDMFALNLPILEKVLRPIVVYFAIVVLLRIFGKRELDITRPCDIFHQSAQLRDLGNACSALTIVSAGGLAEPFGRKRPG